MAVGGVLEKAAERLRCGDLAGAEALCRQQLAQAPDDPAGWHLLGVVMLAAGRAREALDPLGRAAGSPGASALVHYNHGNALAALGDHGPALAAFDRALALRADFAAAWCNAGNSALALLRHRDAIARFERALALDPRLLPARNNLGLAWLAIDLAQEALAAFDQALAVADDQPRTWNNRGNALLALRRPAQALASYERALALAPDLADAHDNRGVALRELGRLGEAILSFGRALELAPGSVAAHCHRADGLREAGRLDEAMRDAEAAIAADDGDWRGHAARGVILQLRREFAAAELALDRAVALAPQSAEAWNARGNLLFDCQQPERALADFEQALARRGDFVAAWLNRGMACQDLLRLDEAGASYERALARWPRHGEALRRRATLRLLRGDESGFGDFETAMAGDLPALPLPPSTLPLWRGEPLAGRRLLLSEPNGLGDTFQFLRLVPQLQAHGATVALHAPRRLHRLLSTFPVPLELIDGAVAAGDFDFQTILWSLPHWLGLRFDAVPAAVPYLSAEPERIAHWRRQLGDDGFCIGLAWQGNPARKIDLGRSLPLAVFAPLARLPGVRLVSLQKNDGSEQLEACADEMPMVAFGEALDGGDDAFVDTAALMASLDLVVSADTAIAHLAGALGRPVWLALRYAPEWRWMLDRTDSPWYPHHRLFRQSAPGDWASVIEAMVAELRSALT